MDIYVPNRLDLITVEWDYCRNHSYKAKNETIGNTSVNKLKRDRCSFLLEDHPKRKCGLKKMKSVKKEYNNLSEHRMMGDNTELVCEKVRPIMHIVIA